MCLPSDTKNTDEMWAENITINEAMKKLNEILNQSNEFNNYED